jgi:hypothetical protein
MESFEELVSAAERQPFQGWDFSYLRGRYEQGEPDWDYRELVLERLGNATSLLDLGTGGGEFLSSLGRLPMVACATEGYQPNTKVALANLKSRGASVVQTWCDNEGVKPRKGALPFRAASFDLVTDRHESYLPGEVLRVLKSLGQFVTQQVGDRNNTELRQLFGVPRKGTVWNLSRAKDELETTGFHIVARGESITRSRFLDVGAVVYLLKAIPWEVPDFSTSRFEKELREVHSEIARNGSFEVTTARFYLVASKE